jgi:hypothetical protein
MGVISDDNARATKTGDFSLRRRRIRGVLRAGTDLSYGHAFFCRGPSKFCNRGSRVVGQNDAERGDARLRGRDPAHGHRAGITENDETRNPNQGENEPSCLIAAGRGARIFPVSTSRSSRRNDLQSSWRI